MRKPMTADENFVRDRIISHFGGTGTVRTWEPDQDPPDFFLRINEIDFAVEVTGLAPVTYTEDGVSHNRTSLNEFGFTLCDSLNLSIGSQVPEGSSLQLFLSLPIMSGGKVEPRKKVLLKSLTEIITGYVLPIGPHDNFVTCQVFDTKIRIKWLPQRLSGAKIVGAIGSAGQNQCLQQLYGRHPSLKLF